MKKVLLIFFAFVIIVAAWYGEARKFYCLDSGKCVTVWKTYNDVCYVIPGKYYGILKPISRNYIQTTNLSELDIIWQSASSDIIANINDSSKIINQSSKSNKIVNYNLDKSYYDSLFTYFDGTYHRYKKDVDYISLFIKENYAIDKNGKKL